MSKKAWHTDDAPAAIGTYSQAVQTGQLVFLSGQIPLDPATMTVVDGDFEARARRVFDNLAAVAAAAGGRLDQVVKVTVFLTDLAHFATATTSWRTTSRPFPARAAVGVSRCPRAPRSRPTRSYCPQAVAAAAEIPQNLTALRGVGPALCERLARLGVTRPVDLLFLLPQRYEDRTRLTPFGALRPGVRAVVEGEIALTEVAYRRRRSLLVRSVDGTGQITLRFFYFSKAQQERFHAGGTGPCFGEPRQGPGGLEMVHPEYRVSPPARRGASTKR